MLAWSAEEAGRIIETYKTLEDKPPDLIMEKNNPDPHSKLVEALTSVKSVNKTDAATLIAAFGTMEGIVAASIEDLSMCPGTVSSVEIAAFLIRFVTVFRLIWPGMVYIFCPNFYKILPLFKSESSEVDR